MKKKYILKPRKSLASYMRGARILKQGGLTLFITVGHGRIAVSPHSSVKGAVNRNRIKRQLREYARVHILPQIGRRNIVIISNSPDFRKTRIDLGVG